MKEIKKGCISLIKNDKKNNRDIPGFLKKEKTSAVKKIHKNLEVYSETPLVRLKNFARKSGLKEFFVKDESKRFGLNAFKGLGGVYALTYVICRELELDINKITFEDLISDEYAERIRKMVFITATDGNHGRGISWAAGQLGCRACVYMPKGSSEIRAQAIRDVNSNAEVEILDMNYDEAVRYANSAAEKNGGYLIQDTSWEGYEEIPESIIQGYTTMADEACESLKKLGEVPTHVFLQAGVGAMACGVTGYMAECFSEHMPKFITVEPENNACIYQSAKVDDGNPHEAVNQDFTIMAGLNCGEPCSIAWEVLKDFGDFYIKCPDTVSEYGMQILATPEGNDDIVVSGESGAVTTGLVALISKDGSYREIKEMLGLDENSVVLCFSTEGDTDYMSYKEIINKNPVFEF